MFCSRSRGQVTGPRPCESLSRWPSPPASVTSLPSEPASISTVRARMSQPAGPQPGKDQLSGAPLLYIAREESQNLSAEQGWAPSVPPWTPCLGPFPHLTQDPLLPTGPQREGLCHNAHRGRCVSLDSSTPFGKRGEDTKRRVTLCPSGLGLTGTSPRAAWMRVETQRRTHMRPCRHHTQRNAFQGFEIKEPRSTSQFPPGWMESPNMNHLGV